MMRADIVADDVDVGHRSRGSAIDLFQEFHELHLPLSVTAQPNDFACVDIKGCKEVKCPLAEVLVLKLGWYWSW
jgi:hypothetical protein